jgi:hypothetical protein
VDRAAVCSPNSDWELAVMAHPDVTDSQLAFQQVLSQDNRTKNVPLRNDALLAETVAAFLQRPVDMRKLR